MTERNPIADIAARLEARLSQRLVDRIRPLLAGRSPAVQRAVLLTLAAEWLLQFLTTGEVTAEAIAMANKHLADEPVERRKALATDVVQLIMRFAREIALQAINQASELSSNCKGDSHGRQ